MDFRVEPSTLHDATVTVPGDKSISHRALMLGSIANGTTDISGFLAGADCLATLQAFRQMGVEISEQDATTLTINGVGAHGLSAPDGDLDLGNSGTAMRLMAGLMAGQTFPCTLSGDASLNSRPNGNYQVCLLFNEGWATGDGVRVFDIAMEEIGRASCRERV